MAAKKKHRPVHRFTVTINPDEGMGLDNADTVRGLIEESLRDSGMDNAASIRVDVCRFTEREDDKPGEPESAMGGQRS